jgi:C-5 cytosine-specific DNA methylase
MKNEKPTHIDLFSGIGGFALAFQREGFRTIGHAEVEPFACAVYHEHFPASVCFGGVQNVTSHSVLERCGELPVVVTGGFPCQPHSLAGKRKASADDRDLWGECKRVLGDLRPRFALFENVGGLLTSERGLFYNRVLSDLAEIRFACLWQVVSAADVGAPHRRERVWLLCVNELSNTGNARPSRAGSKPQSESAIVEPCNGDSKEVNPLADGGEVGLSGQAAIRKLAGGGFSVNSSQIQWPSRPGQPQFTWEPPRVVGDTAQRQGDGRNSGSMDGAQRGGRCGDDAADAASKSVGDANPRRCEQCNTGQRTIPIANAASGQIESALGRMPNGLPAPLVRAWPQVHNRVGQLKGYGNAIVPAVAQIFARAIYKQIDTHPADAQSESKARG